MKHGSAGWENALPVAGTLYAGAFAVMTARVLWEMWLAPAPAAGPAA
jgi:hypothetical protein